MSTTATIIVRDSIKSPIIVQMEFHHDGDDRYNQLVKYLKGKKIFNGIPLDMTIQNGFNGIGCLAAALVCHFKNNEIGSVYLVPPNEKQDDEFLYVVTTNDFDDILVIHDDETTVISKLSKEPIVCAYKSAYVHYLSKRKLANEIKRKVT